MIHEPTLLKRAKKSNRTPEEQSHLEGIAFQMGYKYCQTDMTKGKGYGYEENYVHERFLHGQELGRRILKIRGKLFD